jgi:hypothetical protein
VPPANITSYIPALGQSAYASLIAEAQRNLLYVKTLMTPRTLV